MWFPSAALRVNSKLTMNGLGWRVGKGNHEGCPYGVGGLRCFVGGGLF